MSRRVNDLLVSWEGRVGRGNIMEVWKLAPLCLIWYLWRARNAQSFEDVKILVLELWRIMFNILYTWIAHHSLLVSSFVGFLNFCSSFSSD
jgi:hypothetical protein